MMHSSMSKTGDSSRWWAFASGSTPPSFHSVECLVSASITTMVGDGDTDSSSLVDDSQPVMSEPTECG
jgi:hypothetical protein